jgi:AcrR family transcriptional regulator
MLKPAGPGGSTSRDRILAAAWSLFASEGYAEVSMQEIADAAQVNKATLYHHFGDKEQLFVDVVAADFDQLRHSIEAAVARDGSFREQLIAVADLLFLRSRTDSIRIMMLMHQHVAIMLRNKVNLHSPPPWTPLKPIFERELARGAIVEHDLDLMMTSFFGMVIFQAQRARFMGVTATDEELAENIADLFLNGIRTRPE